MDLPPLRLDVQRPRRLGIFLGAAYATECLVVALCAWWFAWPDWLFFILSLLYVILGHFFWRLWQSAWQGLLRFDGKQWWAKLPGESESPVRIRQYRLWPQGALLQLEFRSFPKAFAWTSKQDVPDADWFALRRVLLADRPVRDDNP